MSELTDLIERLESLYRAASTGPWKVDTKEHVGENWLLGSVIDLGCGLPVGVGEDSPGARYSDWIVTTDRVRASELAGGPAEDAHFIVAAHTLWPALTGCLRALQGFLDYYPHGVNPDLDKAHALARRALDEVVRLAVTG